MGNDPRVLPTGARLGDYTIEGLLGQGGFGITYIARLIDASTDARSFAIKEFFPREIAFRDRDGMIGATGNEDERETFTWALDRFREESRTLAKLNHPNVVAITRYFSANGTACLVMPYYEGEALDRILKQRGRLSPSEFERIFQSLIDALEYLHREGVMHRDIKPANIFITRDGSPVLLDFGTARYALGEHSRSVTSIITPGYAAFEQYSTRGSQQGPWSDIYGLSATIYHAVSGQRPPEAFERNLDDSLVPLTRLAGPDFARMSNLLTMIDAGLAVRPEQRPRTVSQWRQSAASATRTPPSPRSGTGRLVAMVAAGAIGAAVLLRVLNSVWGGSTALPTPGPSAAQVTPALVEVPATPRVAPTDPSTPSPSFVAPTAQNSDSAAMLDLLKGYFAAGSANNLDALMAQYADTVQYYGKNASKALIYQEKARYIQRWPDRSYVVTPNSFTYVCQSDGSCVTRAIVEWTARNSGAGRAAAGQAEVEIGFENGLVTLENSRVIARQH